MCVLHVTSKRSTLSDVLTMTKLPYYASHDKSDPQPYGRNRGKPLGFSGFKVEVSKKFVDLPGQIKNAVRFLKRYRKDLFQLRGKLRACDMTLDFSNKLRIGSKIAAQFDRLPPKLIAMAGELGIGIQLSLYPVSEGDRGNLVPFDVVSVPSRKHV
jgi:hypothetical protein